MKVLLVDRDSDFLDRAKRSLEKRDDRFEVETAASAEDGLEFLDDDEFDAVVSGYKLPMMNGLELLEALRNQDNEIPFIFCTEEDRGEVAIEALNLGADQYLQKGGDQKIKHELLATMIDQEVNRRKAEKRLHLTQFSVDSASFFVYWITPEGKFVYTNEAVSKKLGYT